MFFQGRGYFRRFDEEHPKVIYGTPETINGFCLEEVSLEDWCFERDRMILEAPFGRLPASLDAILMMECQEICPDGGNMKFMMMVWPIW